MANDAQLGIAGALMGYAGYVLNQRKKEMLSEAAATRIALIDKSFDAARIPIEEGMSPEDQHRAEIHNNLIASAKDWAKSDDPKLQQQALNIMQWAAGNTQTFYQSNEEQRLHLGEVVNQQRQAQANADRDFARQSGNDRVLRLDKIADDIRNESQTFQVQRRNYATMRQAAANPSQAGDTALLFSWMKLLDPTSTVREGEFATAQNAAGVPALYLTIYNRTLREGKLLSPEQRRDIMLRAGMIYEPAQKEQNQRNARYLQKGRSEGIPANMLGTVLIPTDADSLATMPDLPLSPPPGSPTTGADGKPFAPVSSYREPVYNRNILSATPEGIGRGAAYFVDQVARAWKASGRALGGKRLVYHPDTQTFTEVAQDGSETPYEPNQEELRQQAFKDLNDPANQVMPTTGLIGGP